MAVRQYVGARYVPKFYKNTQNPNSAEWEEEQSYEAMTIVTYNNGSYTSKVPVPVGVGNPAQNPNYWVNTGNYNAQVELYRQETQDVQTLANQNKDNLNNEINARKENDTTLQNNIDNTNTKLDTEINNRINSRRGNLLLLGDSWCVVDSNALSNALSRFFNKVYNFGASGSVISDLPDEVSKAKTNLSKDEIDSITDIYIVIGTNNVFWNKELTTNYQTYVSSFKTVTNNFPNASVHYFPNTACTGNGGRNGYYQIIMYAAEQCGIAVHPETLLFPFFNDRTSYKGFDNDNEVQHLNEGGSIDFSNAMISLAKGGCACIDIKYNVEGLIWNRLSGNGEIDLTSLKCEAHGSCKTMGGYMIISGKASSPCVYRVTKTIDNILKDTPIYYDDIDAYPALIINDSHINSFAIHNDSKGLYLNLNDGTTAEQNFVAKIPCHDMLGVMIMHA